MKLLFIIIGLLFLATAYGKHPTEPRERPDPVTKDPIEQALGSIQENCLDNYRISYYTNSKASKAVGENYELVWGLFQRGDLECDYRGACLGEVEVNEAGNVRFLCVRRRPQEDE